MPAPKQPRGRYAIRRNPRPGGWRSDTAGTTHKPGGAGRRLAKRRAGTGKPAKGDRRGERRAKPKHSPKRSGRERQPGRESWRGRKRKRKRRTRKRTWQPPGSQPPGTPGREGRPPPPLCNIIVHTGLKRNKPMKKKGKDMAPCAQVGAHAQGERAQRAAQPPRSPRGGRCAPRAPPPMLMRALLPRRGRGGRSKSWAAQHQTKKAATLTPPFFPCRRFALPSLVPKVLGWSGVRLKKNTKPNQNKRFIFSRTEWKPRSLGTLWAGRSDGMGKGAAALARGEDPGAFPARDGSCPEGPGHGVACAPGVSRGALAERLGGGPLFAGHVLALMAR